MGIEKPNLRYGRIVFTWMNDHRGFSKLRPAVVLTRTEELLDHQLFVVAAITTTFQDPPPEYCVALPWHPRGHPKTHLNRRSAAVVNWLASIQSKDIVGYGGDVPEKSMRLIQEKLLQI